MSSEEAASELGKLVDLMDGDKDGFVSREELVNWVMLSFKLVNCSGHQIVQCHAGGPAGNIFSRTELTAKRPYFFV